MLAMSIYISIQMYERMLFVALVWLNLLCIM